MSFDREKTSDHTNQKYMFITCYLSSWNSQLKSEKKWNWNSINKIHSHEIELSGAIIVHNTETHINTNRAIS